MNINNKVMSIVMKIKKNKENSNKINQKVMKE